MEEFCFPFASSITTESCDVPDKSNAVMSDGDGKETGDVPLVVFVETLEQQPFGWEQDYLEWIDYDAWGFRDTKRGKRKDNKKIPFAKIPIRRIYSRTVPNFFSKPKKEHRSETQRRAIK